MLLIQPSPRCSLGVSCARGSALLLWLAVSLRPSLPYFCTERLAGPWEPEEILFLDVPPAFPHRPVLPKRHKLQRLKSEGNQNSGRGNLLPAGTRCVGERGQGDSCVYVLAASQAQLGSLISAQGEVWRQGTGAPCTPYYPRIFRMPPMFSCLQLSSHPGGPTCHPWSPDSKSTLPMHISHL